MKDFIKSHPYLSCAGLALVTNSAVEVYGVIRQEESFEGFVLTTTVICTMPSIFTVVIDKYVHQNLTDNKPIQYGLTAVESVLLNISVIGYLLNISVIFSPSSFKESIETKVVMIITLIQSLGFKYFLDLADEQSEIIETEGYLESDSQILIEI